MKRIVWMSLVSMMVVSLPAAERSPKDPVNTAVKALAAKSNYSWSSESKQEGSDQAFRMTSEGKTEKDGFTLLVLTFGDRNTEVALKGEKVAVKEDDWKSADELEGGSAWMARRFKTFKAPAAEALELAEKAQTLKAGADGLYSGDLTEEGVKQLFARYRRSGAPDAKEAKGSVKFWIKDGALTKYEYNVQGKITMGQDQEERAVNRTTTILIKEVGTTKVSVPEAAKKKLG